MQRRSCNVNLPARLLASDAPSGGVKVCILPRALEHVQHGHQMQAQMDGQGLAVCTRRAISGSARNFISNDLEGLAVPIQCSRKCANDESVYLATASKRLRRPQPGPILRHQRQRRLLSAIFPGRCGLLWLIRENSQASCLHTTFARDDRRISCCGHSHNSTSVSCIGGVATFDAGVAAGEGYARWIKLVPGLQSKLQSSEGMQALA
jgi:hypothetical protein